MRLAPAGTDPALIDERAAVLMMFISGVMQAIARGDRTIRSTEQLEGIIVSVVDGIGATPASFQRANEYPPLTGIVCPVIQLP